MNCRATILSVADVSHIAALPDDHVSMLLLDMHEGMITKGDVALFNNDGVHGACEIWFFVSIDGTELACVSPWERAPCASNAVGRSGRCRCFCRKRTTAVFEA